MSERIPLYRQVKQAIVDRIRSGDLNPGERVPSENALAKMMNVSRITSKQALSELAAEGWVVRLRGKGTFVAEPGSDAATRGKAVGIVVPHLGDSYATGIVLGVEAELAESGYHLVFRRAQRHTEAVAAIRELANTDLQGIVFWPTPGEYINQALVELYLNRFPVVLIDRFLRGIVTDCAQSDHLRGSFGAVRYLMELGHRHIAFVTRHFRHITSVEERYLGYKSALCERFGESAARDPWVVVDGRRWDEQFAEWLEQDRTVTALMCENDDVALQAIDALDHLAYSVPLGMSVVGFGDSSRSTDAGANLTTVRQDPHAIGRAAARLLLERIQKPDGELRQSIMPTRLVVRESTAAPRVAAPKRQAM